MTEEKKSSQKLASNVQRELREIKLNLKWRGFSRFYLLMFNALFALSWWELVEPVSRSPYLWETRGKGAMVLFIALLIPLAIGVFVNLKYSSIIVTGLSAILLYRLVSRSSDVRTDGKEFSLTNPGTATVILLAILVAGSLVHCIMWYIETKKSAQAKRV